MFSIVEDILTGFIYTIPALIGFRFIFDSVRQILFKD